MKIRSFSGWKTRLQAVGLAMLCGVAAMTANVDAFAQDGAAPAAEAVAEAAPAAEPVVEEAVAVVETAPAVVEEAVVEEVEAPAFDSGNVAWMLTSTLLVLMMVIPGLALFYGGMVRSKNVLSVIMQVLVVFSVVILVWVSYGYSAAFTEGNNFFGSFTEKAFLKGIAADTDANGLPEFLFIVFQSTFAGITTALIVGSFAERIKFTAVLLFSIIWVTFSYLPMVHMVWSGGFLAHKGVIDFAGGTVVHINAGIAGLVGAYFVGKRLGYGQTALRPHNVTLTFVGASLLWVGWFGFNAGSNLEATAGAALAFINTLVATAAAVLAWALAEKVTKGKSSALGVASGAVAGLVGITPAAGLVGPFGAVAIGAAAGFVCVWGVTGLKKLLGVDDTADVFGVHAVGGIVGAILTGVFYAPSLGGQGGEDFDMASQVATQALGVGLTIVWIGVVSAVAFLVARLVFGLRVAEDAEREGLDITTHGESAYES